MGGVEYQVTKVDPTDPHTKGAVYQVHKVSEEIAATLGGKVYRARIIKDPTEPTVAGKVYQIVLIDDPDDPSVKGKVYNAILTGGSEAVVVGPAVSPLALDDAIADTLEYVKAYGGTEQNGTPTPDAPVDIVSNNGVLKARHQSGLPLGYTLLEYIGATGTQYITTGTYIADTDTIETEFANSSATGYGALYGIYAMGDSSAFYANGTYYGYDELNNKVNTNVSVDTSWHSVVHDFTNGVLTLDGVDTTFTPFEFVNTSANAIFARYYNSSYGYFFKGYVKKFVVKRNGVIISNLIPAKDSNNVVGLYDTKTGDFWTNSGTGDLVEGPAVSDPVEIYTDGTVETINVHGKNLYDATSTILNLSGAANVPLSQRTDRYGRYLKVQPNTKYTISRTSAAYINLFETAVVPAAGVSTTQYTAMGTVESTTITTSATTQYLYIFAGASAAISAGAKFQVEQGSTATAYQPYYDGGTATAEMLLKLGDYQDVQSIIDGVVTRNVGVLVLDGTENWAENGTIGTDAHRFYSSINSTTDANSSLCTHINKIIQYSTTSQSNRPCIRFNLSGKSIYVYTTDNTTTLTQWTQYLADQYNAGTPVIIVYPLATPTTESVAGQTLQVTDGDNMLEITQASIDGLELEAEYEKEARYGTISL